MAGKDETSFGFVAPRLLRAATEALGEAIIITSAELDEPGPRIEYANPAFARMTGYATSTCRFAPMTKALAPACR